MNKTLTSLFLLLLSAATLSAQKLSSAEQKIVTSVEQNNKSAVGFLEKVVNINSGTLNLSGVKNVGMEFKSEFENLGLKTQWIDMPTEMNRAGHLVAERSGNKGKKLLLIGHLDTVFEADHPLQKFKMLNDSIAEAPGGNDMKGGDVILLFALKALHENGLLNDSQINIVFTGDEESAGRPLSTSRKHLIDAAKKSDIGLNFETSTGFDYATVARRGASGWELETTGKRAHSSGVFTENTGAGAVYEQSRILHEFYQQLGNEKYLTFNPGLAAGGSEISVDEKTGVTTVSGKSNVVAEKMIVKGDLRFISEEQKANARTKMKEIVGANLPQTSATILFSDGYPAMGPTEGNYKLLEKLNKVSFDLGQGIVKAYDPGKRGAADISFVADYVDCLDGLGAMGSGAHSNYETVNLSTFEALTKRTAVLIYRLLNE
jgi:glutamate carboxypeptidase